MPIVIDVKSLKDAVEKLKGLSKEEAVESFKELLNRNYKEQLCIQSFFNYLIEERKSKVFATFPDSIVYKNKDILKKLHNVKILNAERLKK